uniref:Uncharacterized protein n=1 Tax=Caenorhabditis japonica TaxID=281687 RepID=A0A8R1IH09_CAEJA
MSSFFAVCFGFNEIRDTQLLWDSFSGPQEFIDHKAATVRGNQLYEMLNPDQKTSEAMMKATTLDSGCRATSSHIDNVVERWTQDPVEQSYIPQSHSVQPEQMAPDINHFDPPVHQGGPKILIGACHLSFFFFLLLLLLPSS